MANYKIWKYPMRERTGVIHMPPGAKILSCQMQGSYPCFWMLVDVDNDMPTIPRQFIGIGTGDEIPYPLNTLDFIATIQAKDLVFHIFEISL